MPRLSVFAIVDDVCDARSCCFKPATHAAKEVNIRICSSCSSRSSQGPSGRPGSVVRTSLVPSRRPAGRRWSGRRSARPHRLPSRAHRSTQFGADSSILSIWGFRSLRLQHMSSQQMHARTHVARPVRDDEIHFVVRADVIEGCDSRNRRSALDLCSELESGACVVGTVAFVALCAANTQYIYRYVWHWVHI